MQFLFRSRLSNIGKLSIQPSIHNAANTKI